MIYYPTSRVEIRGLTAKYYDMLMHIITAGRYYSLMREATRLMEIEPKDKILDLGAGTGRNACLMMDYLSEEGKLLGLDISEEMITQFKKKCAHYPNAEIVEKRIDKDFGEANYEMHFDKVFISFVLHGFPQEARVQITRNAFNALKEDGEFFILDYNEFPIKEMPFYYRIPFKMIECPYAFDFIEMDCEEMLSLEGFDNFRENLFFGGYVRLLRGVKG